MSRLRTMLRYTRRFPLPLWAGLGVVGVLHLRRSIRGEQQEPISLSAYKMLPLRALSRAAGVVAEAEVPSWARPIVLGGYARAFGCVMDEATVEDVKEYASLGKLFRRRLKDGARAVDGDKNVVASPCDGRVLHCGRVSDCGRRLEQVKGVSYDLDVFLGETPVLTDPKNNALFFAVVYLAPGDYHGFHSSVDGVVDRRAHFSGLLLSVGPWVARSVPGLFNVNERVCYCGQWAHGFFSMAAVGATNVGCVRVPADKDLCTNQREWKGVEKKAVTFKAAVPVNKGEYFGEFNMGSTIVLVYEAPKTHHFVVQSDEVVKMGQAIARTK